MPDGYFEIECPYCHASDSRYVDVSPSGNIPRQWLKCPYCRSRFVVTGKPGDGTVPEAKGG